jgi:hypothetical protein
VSPGPQGLMDGVGPRRTPIAVLAELATQTQHLVFPFAIGALGMLRGTGTIFPVHPIEALSLGTFDPVDNGAGTHAKAASHGTDRLVLANGCHLVATMLGGTVCLLMMLS